jgi:hypothetical protein
VALVVPYDDAVGNSYPQSYWRAALIVINPQAGTMDVSFGAYKDAASFQGAKQPIAGAFRQYSATGADLLTLGAQPPQGATLWAALTTAIEAYALAHDPFFAGATRV